MKALAEKIQSLEKQLKDKKESDDKSEYERAKKDVKEEATKREVNVDLRSSLPWKQSQESPAMRIREK